MRSRLTASDIRWDCQLVHLRLIARLVDRREGKKEAEKRKSVIKIPEYILKSVHCSEYIASKTER